MYNEGISASGDLLDTGVLMGVIEKSGNTYSFGEVKFGVGKETAKNFLKENIKVFKDVDKAVREKVKAGDLPVAQKPAEEEGEEGKSEK